MKYKISIILIFVSRLVCSQVKPPIIINLGSGSPLSSSSSTIASSYIYTSKVTTSNGVDDWSAIQNEIDSCISVGITDMMLPATYYKISKPLFISRTVSGNYAQVTFHLFGRATMWDSFNTTVIELTSTNTFAIGVQMGKGCRISGLHIKGQFSPASVDDYTFFNQTNITDGVCRDSQYSPYAGVAIDPFTNNASQIPGDGGYPGLTSYYKGAGSTTSGSTATEIKDCFIEKFVIGICSSPNAFTRNAEATNIENIKFGKCKYAITGGNDQEKANIVRRIAMWDECLAIFATNLYGAATPGNWDINGVNIANRCKEFIHNIQTGYFASFVENVYAERIGSFGYMTTNLASKVSNCSFNFVEPAVTGYQTSYINGQNIEFDACTFRHYGWTYPITISADGCVFNSCQFSGFPLQIENFSQPGRVPVFNDCIANSSIAGQLGVNQFKAVYKGENRPIYTYGKWEIEEAATVRNGYHQLIRSSSHDVYATITKDASVAATVTNHSFTFTSSSASFYAIDAPVRISGSVEGVGIVTAISGTSVTVSYCTQNIVSGTYSLSVYYPLYFASFIGDLNGTNQITNVKVSWGQPSVGMVFRNPYGSDKFLKITAISGSTYTVAGNISQTQTAAFFGQNTTQEIYTDNPLTPFQNIVSNVIVKKGDIIRQGGNADNATEYKVTQTGIINPNDGDTRTATWATN